MWQSRNDEETFDYIVVGAGSSGSALASRLSENPRHSVLLLEAGGHDRSPWLRLPLGYGKVYHDARVNWRYLTEPVPGLGDRPSYWPRGKVLGGSSSINAMVFVRGHPSDYDEWAEQAPGWSWHDVGPVFRDLERYQGAGSAYRGADGPVPVRDTRAELHGLCEHFFDAAEQLGFTRNPDYNGADMDGVGPYQITVDRGLRASSSRCYLHPALGRTNLHLRTHAHATGITLENLRATGIRYRRRGRSHAARATREVILCGGALNSPQLLELSGIGDARLLGEHGVSVVHDLPSVGEHLADHLGADMVYRSTLPSLNQQLGSWSGRAGAGLRFLRSRSGPLTLSLNQAGGFIRSHTGLDRPDLQLYFSPVSYTRAPPGKRPLIRPDPFPGFLMGFNPCKPTSTGSTHLRSSDPFQPPLIQPNYLATEADRQAMLDGMRLMRALAGTKALSAVIEAEVTPGPGITSDAEMLAAIQGHAWTVFHPCCTCRMGLDSSSSVVDERLRVHGIECLRIADASIFPTIPSGNTNAPAIMVGERAARLIIEDSG